MWLTELLIAGVLWIGFDLLSNRLERIARALERSNR